MVNDKEKRATDTKDSPWRFTVTLKGSKASYKSVGLRGAAPEDWGSPGLENEIHFRSTSQRATKGREIAKARPDLAGTRHGPRKKRSLLGRPLTGGR